MSVQYHALDYDDAVAAASGTTTYDERVETILRRRNAVTLVGEVVAALTERGVACRVTEDSRRDVADVVVIDHPGVRFSATVNGVWTAEVPVLDACEGAGDSMEVSWLAAPYAAARTIDSSVDGISADAPAPDVADLIQQHLANRA